MLGPAAAVGANSRRVPSPSAAAGFLSEGSLRAISMSGMADSVRPGRGGERWRTGGSAAASSPPLVSSPPPTTPPACHPRPKAGGRRPILGPAAAVGANSRRAPSPLAATLGDGSVVPVSFFRTSVSCGFWGELAAGLLSEGSLRSISMSGMADSVCPGSGSAAASSPPLVSSPPPTTPPARHPRPKAGGRAAAGVGAESRRAPSPSAATIGGGSAMPVSFFRTSVSCGLWGGGLAVVFLSEGLLRAISVSGMADGVCPGELTSL